MGLVVIIVKGVTRAVISRAEETINREVSTYTSMMATEEAGSVTAIEEVGSTINVGELGLVIIVRSVVVAAKSTEGMETGSLVDSSWDSVCSITGLVEEIDYV